MATLTSFIEEAEEWSENLKSMKPAADPVREGSKSPRDGASDSRLALSEVYTQRNRKTMLQSVNLLRFNQRKSAETESGLGTGLEAASPLASLTLVTALFNRYVDCTTIRSAVRPHSRPSSLPFPSRPAAWIPGQNAWAKLSMSPTGIG